MPGFLTFVSDYGNGAGVTTDAGTPTDVVVTGVVVLVTIAGVGSETLGETVTTLTVLGVADLTGFPAAGTTLRGTKRNFGRPTLPFGWGTGSPLVRVLGTVTFLPLEM